MLRAEPLTPAGLVARRRALGLTQRSLAHMLGVRPDTIARWERSDLRVARPRWLAMRLASLEAHARRPWGGASYGNAASVNQAPHLPGELTTFVGREAEVATCVDLLSQKRLVTLTGTGGIGKSRLAAQVARRAAGDFPQGVYLVDLGWLEDPVLVPRAVSTALGLARGAGESITDMLIEALRRKKLLLLMDDCDHVVRECGELVYRLLRGAPSLAILATCREPFDIRGETVWRVQGLKTPASDAGFDEIVSSEAVQLFVERARAVAPWFDLTEASASVISHLCRRLDGIPLALELAAARLKALNLDELVARLEPRLEFLTTGRTTPSRQQTLRATIDFSYRLLSTYERVLFRRLSVFADGWTVEAAERVTEGGQLAPADTLDLLEHLYDKSMVVCDERLGTVRQSMLDTLREYAHERLVEADEEDTVRRRHFEWVLNMVQSIDPNELSPSGIAVIGLELQNLRGALAWSIDASEVELGLRLAAAASKVWNYGGHYAEGIRWVQRTLDLPGAVDLPRLKGPALKWIGALQYGLGDMQAARASISEGCALMAGLSDAHQPPLCAQLLGNVARSSGDLDRALRLYQQALSEYAELGLPFWEDVALFLMAWVLFEQGEYAASQAACDRCLARGQGRTFTWATSRVRVILAYLAERDGDDARAERLAQEALSQLHALVQPSGIIIPLRALSQFALDHGRLGRAWSYLAEMLEIACVVGDCMGLASTLETVACVLASRAPCQAAQIAGAASVLRTRTGTVPLPSEQACLTRWLGAARGKIGERAFQADWEVGEALSDAEAISAARQFVSEALGSPGASEAIPAANGPLTARQREVVGLVVRGLTNEQIARELVISPATARVHVEHVLRRLDLHSRAQLAAWASAHELVTTRQV